MPIGFYDPDDPDQEYTGKMMTSALEAKTPLQESALLACGRTGKRFHDTAERAAFRKQEQKAMAATDEGYLYRAWILSRIEFAAKKNEKGLAITLPNLIKIIGNTEKRNEWMAVNRNKVLAERRGQAKKDELKEILNARG